MTSAYPGALDDFSESSPTYMADPDATGRVHSARHNDVESAIEQVQETLGVNPQGPNATVAERIAGITDQSTVGMAIARNLTVAAPSGGHTAMEVQGSDGNRAWFDQGGGGNNVIDAASHFFRYLGGPDRVTFDQAGSGFFVGTLNAQGRNVPTHYWDESVGRRLFVWDTVNARWQMVYGDTGWREVKGELVNGWTADGVCLIRRIDNTVRLFLGSLNPSAATGDAFYVPTDGFRGGYFGPLRFTVMNTANEVRGLNVDYSNGVRIDNRGAASYNTEIEYTTQDVWPSSLPGVPREPIPTLLPADDTPADIDPDIPTGLSPDDDTSDWTVTYPDGPTP